jgi:P27 family predicted phage terminase small subunit
VPRTKKPAGTTVDRRNGRRAELAAVPGGRIEAPEGLSVEAITLWNAYWDDAASTVQTPADRGVLLRWVTEYDRYLRLIAEADQRPLMRGSQGQEVANPLYKLADRALAAAERAEKQLGVGALNRSALGIAVIAEQRSLADMNARYGGGHDDGDVATPITQARFDPRVIEA